MVVDEDVAAQIGRRVNLRVFADPHALGDLVAVDVGLNPPLQDVGLGALVIGQVEIGSQ
jgi:hypothetical protein